MKDLMVDIESFGNGKNACIVQIGAAYFDRSTGEVGDTFTRNIDAGQTGGGEIDADTIYWWLSQSPEAIAGVTTQPRFSLYEVLADFNNFARRAECIWSHATFDFVIIMESYRRLGIKPLFGFRTARDIRTLIDLAGVHTGSFVRSGTPHNALDDCLYQIKYCVAAFSATRWVTPDE